MLICLCVHACVFGRVCLYFLVVEGACFFFLRECVYVRPCMRACVCECAFVVFFCMRGCACIYVCM